MKRQGLVISSLAREELRSCHKQEWNVNQKKKNYSKYNIDLNVKPKTIKLLDNNEENLETLNQAKCLRYYTKSMIHKRKNGLNGHNQK